MSRTPNTRKQETHERIVDVAARAIRQHGYAGVGVADVMKQAGLTHGGFYAHFDSRDALLVEALERAGRESGEAVTRAVEQRGGKGRQRLPIAGGGLPRRRHLASLETGCPVAALACDMPRQSVAVREASAVRVRRLDRGACNQPCHTHACRRRAWWPARSSARCNSRARWATTPKAARCWRRRARRCIHQYDTPGSAAG